MQNVKKVRINANPMTKKKKISILNKDRITIPDFFLPQALVWLITKLSLCQILFYVHHDFSALILMF